MEPSTSPKWSINWTDLYKALRGGLLVFIAAFSTEFVVQVQTLIETGVYPKDFGSLVQSLSIAAVATIVELGRRYLTNYQSV